MAIYQLSNRNPNPNPNATAKQHAIVNMQLNIVTCPRYPGKFIRNTLIIAPSALLQVVIVTPPPCAFGISTANSNVPVCIYITLTFSHAAIVFMLFKTLPCISASLHQKHV